MLLASFILSVIGQATESSSPLDQSAIMVAIVSVLGTLGASWLMFRGKTQDTANWLIVELRTEAKEARQSALECEIKRSEDRKIIDEMRGMIAGLQGGLRRLNNENQRLQTRLDEAESNLSDLKKQYGHPE